MKYKFYLGNSVPVPDMPKMPKGQFSACPNYAHLTFFGKWCIIIKSI
ncbi:MAG: hypothetical protein HFJ36_01520 [Clostridia bacterium]|nr:hypothetical protein [Clostridia bacterium]